MRRTPWSRPLTALLAVWFALVTVDPALLHSCPMHEGRLAQGGDAALEPAAQALPDSGSEHHGHHAAASPGQSEQTPSCCTCLGDCSAPPVAWMETPARIATRISAATADRGLPDHAYVPVAAAHVLPFAIGPPQRA